MPLTQLQKREALGAITEQLDAVNTVYLTDYQGLTVAQANGLRRAMRAADIEFKVLKNTLLKRAMEQKGGFDELFDQLNGPTAVALSNDPSGPAKVLKKFLADNSLETPRFKGAYIDGAIYADGNLDALASLKSKDELVADILGLLLAPITNVARALSSQGAGLASIVQQISDGDITTTGGAGSSVDAAPATEAPAEDASAADDADAAPADDAPAADASAEAEA
ncbi:MAG TPA: 50S ribosomal protein L10 [Rubricoccaceae bacterium]|jgi:large subunit ribosomal protein L10